MAFIYKLILSEIQTVGIKARKRKGKNKPRSGNAKEGARQFHIMGNGQGHNKDNRKGGHTELKAY